ncbi:MAG: MATE family efflux transporter, partial [Pseudomonadota bacterium]
MSLVTDQAQSPPSPGARDVLTLAWPMTLKAVFLHGAVVIDGWLVSSLGEVSLAAMGLAAAIGGMVLGVIFAFSHAMQIRTAQAAGVDDPVYLKSTLAAGLAISLAIGCVGVLLLSFVGRPLIEALAQSAEIAALSWSYLAVFQIVVL